MGWPVHKFWPDALPNASHRCQLESNCTSITKPRLHYQYYDYNICTVRINSQVPGLLQLGMGKVWVFKLMFKTIWCGMWCVNGIHGRTPNILSSKTECMNDKHSHIYYCWQGRSYVKLTVRLYICLLAGQLKTLRANLDEILCINCVSDKDELISFEHPLHPRRWSHRGQVLCANRQVTHWHLHILNLVR